MYYNLEAFGNRMRIIRKKLGLTQKDVYEIARVHMDTLRKIENGKVLPTQETLDILAPILKTDLNELLLKYRLNAYPAFEEVKNRLESKIDKDEYQTLEKELEQLEALLNEESNAYFINLINQLILLTKSIVLNKKHNRLNESLEKLVEAMKITTSEFSINNYKSFLYNSMELRLLMNIALLINKIDSTEKSLEIMEFCMNMVDTDSNIYPKLCYNLSYTYHRLDMHDKALVTGIIKWRDFGKQKWRTFSS